MITYYTEDEYSLLQRKNSDLRRELSVLREMRPQWAQGYTSDSVAAQISSVSLQEIWDRLGATSQTDCILRLDALIKAAP